LKEARLPRVKTLEEFDFAESNAGEEEDGWLKQHRFPDAS
jgi:hypothetical protein